jgi:hypothetical protein
MGRPRRAAEGGFGYHAKNNDELRRFQREAEELLEIKKK